MVYVLFDTTICIFKKNLFLFGWEFLCFLSVVTFASENMVTIELYSHFLIFPASGSFQVNICFLSFPLQIGYFFPREFWIVLWTFWILCFETLCPVKFMWRMLICLFVLAGSHLVMFRPQGSFVPSMEIGWNISLVFKVLAVWFESAHHMSFPGVGLELGWIFGCSFSSWSLYYVSMGVVCLSTAYWVTLGLVFPKFTKLGSPFSTSLFLWIYPLLSVAQSPLSVMHLAKMQSSCIDLAFCTLVQIWTTRSRAVTTEREREK